MKTKCWWILKLKTTNPINFLLLWNLLQWHFDQTKMSDLNNNYSSNFCSLVWNYLNIYQINLQIDKEEEGSNSQKSGEVRVEVDNADKDHKSTEGVDIVQPVPLSKLIVIVLIHPALGIHHWVSVVWPCGRSFLDILHRHLVLCLRGNSGRQGLVCPCLIAVNRSTKFHLGNHSSC